MSTSLLRETLWIGNWRGDRGLLSCVLALLAVALNSPGQGSLKFQNGTATRITFGYGYPNNGYGLAPGTAFVVGLYLGPYGAAEGGLSLHSTTTIAPIATSVTHPLAGVFNGGNPLVVTGFSDLRVAFMIKVWSAGYPSFEAAMAGNSWVCAKSDLGYYTLAVPPTPPRDIMAVNPTDGQVAPFRAVWIPEPSCALLLGFGLATVVAWGRRT